MAGRQALAWRLRTCARSCTFQAVANLANAYAKFGFESPAGTRSSVGLTDQVFDLIWEELPRHETGAFNMFHLESHEARVPTDSYARYVINTL